MQQCGRETEAQALADPVASPISTRMDDSTTVDVLKQIDEHISMLDHGFLFAQNATAKQRARADQSSQSPSRSPARSVIHHPHVTELTTGSPTSKQSADESFPATEHQAVGNAATMWEELHIREQLAHQACLSGNASALNYALSFSFPLQPDVPGEGLLSPLHEAAAFGSVSILSFLLYGLKVDVNIRTNKGNTALHVACFEGNMEATEFLISAGASVTATNQWEQIAFDLAQGDVVKALRGDGPPCTLRAAAHLMVSKSLGMFGLGPDAGVDDARHMFRTLAGKVRAEIVQGKAPQGGAGAREALEGLCKALEVVKRRDDAARLLADAAVRRPAAWAETYHSLELWGAEHAADWMVQNHIDVEAFEELPEDEQLNALLDLGMEESDATKVCQCLGGAHKDARGGLSAWLRQRGLAKLAPSLEAGGICSIATLREALAAQLRRCVRLVGPRRKLMEAIRTDLGGKEAAHQRQFAGAVTRRGSEPGSIVVTSGSMTLQLGKSGQLSALQGTLKPSSAAQAKAGGLRKSMRGEGGAVIDEERLATVAQLVGSVKRETKLGQELRARQMQWRRRVEGLEEAAREARAGRAAALAEKEALVASWEKRGKASTDRYYEKEMECAKLADQVSSLGGYVEELKRLAGYPAWEEDSSGWKVAHRELQMQILELRGALADARKDLSLERSVTSSLQERLEAVSAELQAERGRREAAERARGAVAESMERLERLQEERQQWAAQVEQLMADVYQASVAQQQVLLTLAQTPPETVDLLQQLRSTADHNRRLQGELATARIIEQRYWSDFLSEPSLAQIEAAARPVNKSSSAASYEAEGDEQATDRTSDAELLESLLSVREPKSEEGASQHAEDADRKHGEAQRVAGNLSLMSEGHDTDHSLPGQDTEIGLSGGQGSPSASEGEVSTDNSASFRPALPRRYGEIKGPMRGALQRAQKHVLGVWSGGKRGL